MAVCLPERGPQFRSHRAACCLSCAASSLRASIGCGNEFKKGAAAEEHARASHRPSTQQVTEILIRDGDSFEVALKRFTRKVQQAGVLSEAKRHMHYEPPSVKRKRKAENRARKERKARAKAAARGY